MTRERESRGQGGARQERGGKIEAEVGVGTRGEETGLHEHTILLRQPEGTNIRRLESAEAMREEEGLSSLRT